MRLKTAALAATLFFIVFFLILGILVFFWIALFIRALKGRSGTANQPTAQQDKSVVTQKRDYTRNSRDQVFLLPQILRRTTNGTKAAEPSRNSDKTKSRQNEN